MRNWQLAFLCTLAYLAVILPVGVLVGRRLARLNPDPTGDGAPSSNPVAESSTCPL